MQNRNERRSCAATLYDKGAQSLFDREHTINDFKRDPFLTMEKMSKEILMEKFKSEGLEKYAIENRQNN